MYKVVIIDDEPIIVEGLKKTVCWENFQCRVAGVAFSGEEGLTLIRNEKPDIIFTDIQMPRLDGLTMIAAIKSEFPNTQVAILTGYRDFDYAQKAIRLGVARFLLKPSKMDELMEALEAMTKKLTDLDSGYVQEEKEEGNCADKIKDRQDAQSESSPNFESGGHQAEKAKTLTPRQERKGSTARQAVLSSRMQSHILKKTIRRN